MSPTSPRPHRSAALGARTASSRHPAAARRQPQPSRAAAKPAAAVRVLVAGVDRDARAGLESLVRQSFASRPAGEAWTVSLVRLAGRWSASVEGPGAHSASFTALDEPQLLETLRHVVEGNAAVAALAAGSPSPDDTLPFQPPARPSREPHPCEQCGQAFVVVYERQPDEPCVRAPVACPHCWTLNFVEVGDWAAAGHDYRAEKA